MDIIDLKKNRLDKEYDFESKKAMGWFTLGTITFIGFVATMMIYRQYIFAGVFGFLILIFSIIFFRRSQRRIKHILMKVESLKELEK